MGLHILSVDEEAFAKLAFDSFRQKSGYLHLLNVMLLYKLLHHIDVGS